MNKQLLEHYIEAYGTDIYSFCIRLTQNRELAEELYQDTSYYKVVVFIDPLQGLYAILLEILWIVFTLLPPDGLRKATTTVSLYIC